MAQHKKSLLLLFTANGISGFAQGISMLAIPWYFASRSGSTYFNAAYGVITFIILFFGLYAGTLVDKFSRKSNFLGSSLICCALLLGISLVGFWQQSLSDLLVVSVFGITMLNYNIHYPTLYAFGQEISDASNYAKVNANIEIVGQSTSIVSGAFAAVLLEGADITVPLIKMNIHIGSWHIWEIFLLNAFTYFLASLLIAQIRYTPNPNLHIIQTNLWKRLNEGFSYLRKHPQFLVFGLFSYSVFAMLLVEIHAVLPAYVEKHLHAKGSVFALSDLWYAVGALSAGLFVTKVFSSRHTVRTVIGLTLVTAGIFLWAFASRSVAVIYTMMLILGFANAGIRVLRLTYLFNHIPNEIMGRVNSIFNMMNVLTRSLFIFLFSLPFFTFGNQVIWAFFIMAVFLVLSALILLINNKRAA